MKRIYLIRHGLPDFPQGKRMCLGRTDIPLSAAGLEQAREMAQKLPPITALFSSPLIRAVQTAQAIDMPITVLEGLREMDAGQWDGLTFDQIRQRFPQLYAARGADPTLPLPGGESREEGRKRFQAALESAVAQSAGDLAVVAHGGVIAAFLEHITGRGLKPEYTQMISLIWEDGTFRLQEEN